jgi:hypothetical protein
MNLPMRGSAFMSEKLARLPNLLTCTLIVLIAATYFAPFADLDFAWQIRTGELIVRTGQLRPPESFTYTIAGRSIPDFEWLYEVILWATWSVFGYGGLKLWRLVLVGATLWLAARRLRSGGVAPHGIALAMILAVWILAPGWNLRPLYCTSIGLLLLTGWLHDHCTGKRPLPWYLPILTLAWANLHPGVIMAQGLLAGAIGWEGLNRRIGLNNRLDSTAWKRLACIGGLGLAATFISPNPIERILYPFRPELAHPIMRVFVEMQPLHSFLSVPPYTPIGAYLLFGLTTVTIVCRFRCYRLWEIGLLVGLAGLATLAYRSLQDCVLILMTLAIPHLAAMLSEAAIKLRSAPKRPRFLRLLLRWDRRCKLLFSRPFIRFQPRWIIATAAIFAAMSLFPPFGRSMPRHDGDGWPAGAGDYIERADLRGRFFAEPDFGSYLTWRMSDRARTYVDTRGFFFPPELLEDSNFLPQLTPEWPGRLERVLSYGTDYFLLETTGARGEMWRVFQPLTAAPLYQDDLCVLLTAEQVRRAAAEYLRLCDKRREIVAQAARFSP